MGVWAALDDSNRTLVLDTEGRLGLSQNDNVRNRLLLKILCISDIIIFRTRAPKLPNDMFQFLSDASNAFIKYFKRELENVMKTCQAAGPLSTMGPTLIVFHETQHTEVLKGEGVSVVGTESRTVRMFRHVGRTQDGGGTAEGAVRQDESVVRCLQVRS